MNVSFGLVLSLLMVVSLSLSAVINSDTILVPTVKTAVVLGKPLHQTYSQINVSLEFTNNVKGFH